MKNLEQNLSNIISGCVKNNTLMQKALYALCYDEMMKVCNRYKKEGKMMGWVKRIVINLNMISVQ